MAPKEAVDPIAAVLATAEKKYGINAGPIEEIAGDGRVVSTGNMAIDYILGGGVPIGRLLELFGLPSCGKTTLALQIAAHYQKIIVDGGDADLGIWGDSRIVYFDYEQTMDTEYAKALGLDVEHPSFILAQPDTLESGSNLALDLVKTGRVALFVFDSVAGMNPSAKSEAEIGKSLPAVQAKLMKDFLMNLTPLLHKNDTTAVFLNHQMDKMEMGGGRRPGMPAAITTPGGVALKYFATQRIQFTKIKDIKSKVLDPIKNEMVERPMATDVKVKVVKNKVAPPFRETNVRSRYGKGFDQMATALLVLIQHKKIMYGQGYFYFHNLADEGMAPEWMARSTTGTKRPYIRTEAAIYKAAKEHPEWAEKLIQLAQEAINLRAKEAEASDDAEDVDEEDSSDNEE